MCRITVLLLPIVFMPIVESARILCVFPLPSENHQAVFRTLTDELLQRNHEIVVVTSDPGYKKNETPSNLKEIDVHDIAHDTWNTEMANLKLKLIEDPDPIYLPEVHVTIDNIFTKIFTTKEFQKIVKEDNNFDLLILEACAHSNLFLSHLIKAPVILLSTFGSVFNYQALGAPSQEFLYPSVLRQKTVDMSFWEEIYDIYQMKTVENFATSLVDVQTESFKNLIGSESPTLQELNNDIDLLMLNHYPLWEGIRPVPLNVIHMGGLHVKNTVGSLSQDIQQLLNSSTNGVIYISFGTTVAVSQLPRDRVLMMLNVLSQLPYDVLLKWDGEPPVTSPNIKMAKWVPQADLLRHPKIKLFITQGGLQSTDEAIAGGVPLIGMPFLFDQFFNCENYVRHKIGVKLSFGTFTEEEFKDAVTKVITDKGYRENVAKLRILMQDRPQTSLNRVIWWTEFVLRHGGAKHLRSPSANMPWTQYLEVELLFIALFLYVLLLIAVILVCYCLIRLVGRCYKGYRHRKLMNGMFPR